MVGWISRMLIATQTPNYQEDPKLRWENAKHMITTVVGPITERRRDLEGDPLTISLTWLCRSSGIRADGVGASGSQGWLPAL